jgi:acetyl-CoA C-acetyltransferase
MGHHLLYNDGMIDAFYNIHTGETAANIAEIYQISREGQDEFALMSHHRACNAINNKIQASELVPVEVRTKKKGPASSTTTNIPARVLLWRTWRG